MIIKNKLFFIFLSLFILFSFSVLADYENLFIDDFEYSTTFVSNGWDSCSASGFQPCYPAYFNGIRGFGTNYSYKTAGFSMSKNIQKTFSTSYDVGDFYYSTNVYVINKSTYDTSLNQDFYIRIAEDGSSSSRLFIYVNDRVHYNTTKVTVLNNYIGGESCIMEGNITGIPYNMSLEFYVNLDEDTYTLVQDGNYNISSDCYDKRLSTLDATIGFIELAYSTETWENFSGGFDSFSLQGSEWNSSIYGDGADVPIEDAIDDVLDDFGVNTTTSKYIIGIVLLFISVVVMATATRSALVTVITALFMSIALVYMGFLPVWIIFLYILIGIGGTTLYVKSHIE